MDISKNQIYQLAENSLKMGASSNSSPLVEALYKHVRGSVVKDLASDIKEAMKESELAILTFDPETEEDMRVRSINRLTNVIEKHFPEFKFKHEAKGRGSNVKYDYSIQSDGGDFGNTLVIEAKKKGNKIFTSKNNVSTPIARQCKDYMNTSANPDSFGIVILTNGVNLAVFVQGNLKYKNKNMKNWQPLHRKANPIFTMSCLSASDMECQILAYLIYLTLTENHQKLLSLASEIYENKVVDLINRCKANGINVVE